ncbi:alpha/beta hydrolase [Altererythrobacter aquiaggeris]|uniref:alpha/beta hydrolase n=1 Tax=Aestuarierythrobacter aquiaggeris TaxID=1898396 RepID=UPI00301724C3
MRTLTNLFIAPFIAPFIVCATILAAPAAAQVVTERVIVEEWVNGEWVEVGSQRFVDLKAAQPSSHGPAAIPQGIAAYGPFRVLDDGRAALVDATGALSPGQFGAMLRDYPQIATLEMIDCPGTDDDRANLAVGRMIRSAGITTVVPAGGSVRSGAVELFLAGAKRRMDENAEFAVHAWMDELGRGPSDFAMNAEQNRIYLEYYREMGMTGAEAAAFYAMTNSAANKDARWLSGDDMGQWLNAREEVAPPKLAYLDLAATLP